MIWKRVFAATIGLVTLFAGAVAVFYAIDARDDFYNPAVSFRFALLGSLFMWSIAVILALAGFRYLTYARSGKSKESKRWVRVLILGIGSFFPGFVFSLPLTTFWADHYYGGDAQAPVEGVGPSFVIGILSSIACTVYQLRKQKTQSRKVELLLPGHPE